MNPLRLAGVAGAALLAVLLAACASLPEPASVLSGRLSVQVAAAAGAPARGFHAAFELRGDAERGQLDLSTPLGPRVAEARWAPGQVELRSTEGDRRFASLDALSRELLGEALPLQALPDWLRGRPWPGAAHLADDGGFRQLGWRVDTTRLDTGFVGASRDAAPAVTLRARLQPTPP